MADRTEFTTFYTVLARWPHEVRLMSIEWEVIESEKEALEAVKQNDHSILVFRNDPDVPRRDVSEDIAWKWLRELITEGFSPEEDDMPSFIAELIKIEDAIKEFSDGRIPMAAE